jgi:uncharacterized protein (DUF2147 family)
MKQLTLILIILVASLPMFSQSNAEKICGTYLVVEKSEVSKVKITRMSNGNFEGKIVWMKNPKFDDGTPKTDVMNPDPSKRKTPADKIVLLHNFKYDSKNDEWSGEIYNPVEGNMYKAYAKFESPKKLKVRGYVGLPIFGRSMYWDKLD